MINLALYFTTELRMAKSVLISLIGLVFLFFGFSTQYVNAQPQSDAVETISQDETARNEKVPTISIADASEEEGDADTVPLYFEVTLSQPADQPVTVHLQTADSTAIAAEDYQPRNWTITFRPGVVRQSVRIDILPDDQDEADEMFIVRLSDPVEADIQRGQALGTIRDNDPLPFIYLQDITITTLEDSTEQIHFALALSAPSSYFIHVEYYARRDGLLEAGMMTIPPNRTEGHISVKSTPSDAKPELELQHAENARIADIPGLSSLLLNGVGERFARSTKSPMTLDEVVYRVLTRNPTIRSYYNDLIATRHRALSATAPFTTALTFNVAPNFFLSQERIAIIRSEIPTAYDNANPLPVDVSLPNGGRGLIWVPQPISFELGDWPITASSEYENYTVESSISLSRQFRWGPRIDFFKLQSNYWIKPYDRLPYTMNLLSGFSIPLLKNFGPNNNPDALNAATGQLETRAAYWRFRSALNNVLIQTVVSYWDLVLSYEQLKFAVARREANERIVEDTRRLMEMNRYNIISFNQLQTQMLQSKQNEEQAVAYFLQSSNNLKEMMGMDDPATLLPQENLTSLQARKVPDPQLNEEDAAIDIALTYRPELHVSVYDEKMARLHREFAQNQTKPDLTFFGNFNLMQQGPYGYKDPYHAFKNVFNPDAIMASVGLTYFLPLKNPESKNNLQAAKLNEKNAVIERERQIRTIKTAVKNTWLNLESYDAQLAYAREAFEVNREIYSDYERLGELGRVSELDLAEQHLTMAQARYNYMESLILYLQIQARLKGVCGTIADEYPSWQEWDGLDEHEAILNSE